MEALDELAIALRERLIERARAGESSGAALEAEVRALVEREAGSLPGAERDALCRRVLLLATGLGPLEPLLSDPAVDEVMVNGPGEVYVERRGRLERSGVSFAGEAELMHAIERVLAPLGRRVDEASPLCDARLPDGSRVNVVIPPLSLSGPCLTVRRFRHSGFSLRELVAGGTMPGEIAELLALCVAARAAVLVSGGTGSGKTTTLNALSGAIPGEERIVTIEDAAELRLRQRHVVRLESRPANVEGRGEVTIRQLVVNALRMRPDRIVVGEVRGPEALDMLQALNTGHDGSLTTVHANSPADALRRIETLALMAGVGLPHAAVRDQVTSALDVVVHQARLPDGARAVESVSEVTRVAGGAGTRELWARGGTLREPGPGELARRLDTLRATVLPEAAIRSTNRDAWPEASHAGRLDASRATVLPEGCLATPNQDAWPEASHAGRLDASRATVLPEAATRSANQDAQPEARPESLRAGRVAAARELAPEAGAAPPERDAAAGASGAALP